MYSRDDNASPARAAGSAAKAEMSTRIVTRKFNKDIRP